MAFASPRNKPRKRRLQELGKEGGGRREKEGKGKRKRKEVFGWKRLTRRSWRVDGGSLDAMRRDIRRPPFLETF